MRRYFEENNEARNVAYTTTLSQSQRYFSALETLLMRSTNVWYLLTYLLYWTSSYACKVTNWCTRYFIAGEISQHMSAAAVAVVLL